MRSDVRLGLLCVSLVILLIPSPTQAQGDVVLEIVTHQNHEPGYELAPFDIQFIVCANGHKIQDIVFCFEQDMSFLAHLRRFYILR